MHNTTFVSSRGFMFFMYLRFNIYFKEFTAKQIELSPAASMVIFFGDRIYCAIMTELIPSLKRGRPVNTAIRSLKCGQPPNTTQYMYTSKVGGLTS